MGAIDANVLLATDSTLSMEKRQELQGIVNRYETFSAGMVGNAGKIIAETDLYNKTSSAEFNSKYRWSGSNSYERSASQYAAAALSNQEIPGGRYKKVLDEPGPNGENIVSVTTYLDPKAPENKGLFDDEEMYPRNENGEVVLEWKKDLNKWDEGLLEEIEPVPDSIKIFQTAGITDERGGFNNNQYINVTSNSRTVNVSGWAGNRVLQDDIKSKAIGLQGMRDDELSSFLQVKMKLGPNFSMTEFREKTTPEQIKEIQDELNEEYIIQKTSGLNSREAKEGEPGAIIDPLNPTKENGDKNYKIYYEAIKGSKITNNEDSSNQKAAQYKIEKFVETVITENDPTYFVGKKIAGKTVSAAETDVKTGKINLFYLNNSAKEIPLGGYQNIDLNNKNSLKNIMEQLIARGGDPTKDEIIQIKAMEKYLDKFKFPGEDSVGKFVRTDEDTRPLLPGLKD